MMREATRVERDDLMTARQDSALASKHDSDQDLLVTDRADGDDAPLIVFSESVSAIPRASCTIHFALKLTRDTFTHAVGDVASLAQYAMIALRAAGFGDLEVPACHLTNASIDDETGRVTAHVATYQFAIVIRDIAAIPQAFTALAAVAAHAAEVEKIEFSHSDRRQLAPRRERVDAAQSRPETLAVAHELRAGAVIVIHEKATLRPVLSRYGAWLENIEKWRSVAGERADVALMARSEATDPMSRRRGPDADDVPVVVLPRPT